MNDYIYHFICDICDRIQTRERERGIEAIIEYILFQVSRYQQLSTCFLMNFLLFMRYWPSFDSWYIPKAYHFQQVNIRYTSVYVYIHCEETCWWLLIYHFYRCLYLFHSSNLRPSLSANLHPHLTSFNEICLAKSEKKTPKTKTEKSHRKHHQNGAVRLVDLPRLGEI